MIIELFQKKSKQEGWKTYFFEKNSETFRILTLSLEILDKTKLYPWKFCKLVLQLRTSKAKIITQHEFFLTNPGNSPSFSIDPWNFHVIFFNTLKIPCPIYLHIYMYIYIYIYIYIYLYIYVCIFIYIHIYIYINMYIIYNTYNIYTKLRNVYVLEENQKHIFFYQHFDVFRAYICIYIYIYT